VQYSKFDIAVDGPPVTPEERLFQFRCLVMQKGMSDVEVLEKFCRPSGKTFIDRLQTIPKESDKNSLMQKLKF
jgi:hypothetical protein